MKKTALRILSVIMTITMLFSLCAFNFSALDIVEGSGDTKPTGNVIVIPIPPKDPSSGETICVTYECCDECGYEKTFNYSSSADIKARTDGFCLDGENAFICWTDENGNRYYCGDALPKEDITLKAQKMPLLLRSDEVLSFSNSDEDFHTEEFDGYYMSDAHYNMMKKNTNKLFGTLNPIAIGLNAVFATYPYWEWNGSCYGMSTLAFLQHYGAIDVLEPEKGIDSVSDFTNSADVASKVNYYQWSAAGSFLCENFGLKKGSAVYSSQLKNLYDTVAEGNIVLFTFYSGDIFVSSGHTVLLTGAYTENDGTRVLIAYDCNNPEDYLNGEFEQRFYIDPDCTTIKREYNLEGYAWLYVGAFNWTDDYEHFKAFDINGNSDKNAWYSHFFTQLWERGKSSFKAIIGK